MKVNLLRFSIYSKGIIAFIEDYKNELKIKKFYISCINPHSYVVAKNNDKFHKALSNSKFLVPDGVGIKLASKIFNLNIQSRITGFDLFININKYLNNISGNIFLLGANDKTLSAIKNKINYEYPNIKIVGMYSPPYKDIFDEQDKNNMIMEINNNKVDMLWIGISSPKQDILISELIDSIDIKSAACVGAVFDYYSGNIRRPGVIIRRLGLEWVMRFINEPKRLWKRTFISNGIFLIELFKNLIKQKK